MILHERGLARLHFTYDVCCQYSLNMQRAILSRTLRRALPVEMFLPSQNGELGGRDWLLEWLHVDRENVVMED
jgi:hypothetical protein